MNTQSFGKLTNRLKQFSAGLLLSAFCLQIFAFTATAQSVKIDRTNKTIIENEENVETKAAPQSKIAPDLEEKADELFYQGGKDVLQKVIIKLKSETPLDELTVSAMNETDRIQMFAEEAHNNKTKAGMLVSDLAAVSGTIKKSYNNVGLVSAELPLSRIKELVYSDTVEYISPDRAVASYALGHVEVATLASAGDARTEVSGFTSLNGTNVGVAVLDSGIDVTLQQY